MRYFDYSPMYYHMSFWPGGLISLLINILIWGGIIYLVLFIVRKVTSTSHHADCCGACGHEHAHQYDDDDSVRYMDVVKMRYAKGEINKKEYEELKQEFSDEMEPYTNDATEEQKAKE